MRLMRARRRRAGQNGAPLDAQTLLTPGAEFDQHVLEALQALELRIRGWLETNTGRLRQQLINGMTHEDLVRDIEMTFPGVRGELGLALDRVIREWQQNHHLLPAPRSDSGATVELPHALAALRDALARGGSYSWNGARVFTYGETQHGVHVGIEGVGVRQNFPVAGHDVTVGADVSHFGTASFFMASGPFRLEGGFHPGTNPGWYASFFIGTDHQIPDAQRMIELLNTLGQHLNEVAGRLPGELRAIQNGGNVLQAVGRLRGSVAPIVAGVGQVAHASGAGFSITVTGAGGSPLNDVGTPGTAVLGTFTLKF
jgi:hypothetical protein